MGGVTGRSRAKARRAWWCEERGIKREWLTAVHKAQRSDRPGTIGFMPRKPSQQARLALKCNPGEGTHANKSAINPQGSIIERGIPSGTPCLTLRNAGRNKVEDVAQRRRFEPSAPDLVASRVASTLRGPRGISPAAKGVARVVEQRAAFMASSLMSVARVACKVTTPVPRGPSR